MVTDISHQRNSLKKRRGSREATVLPIAAIGRNYTMENDRIAIGAQIGCKCDRWPERLLQLGCLHHCCHRCDKNGFEALENANRYAGARSSWDTAAVCTACDEAIKQSADGPNDKTLAAEKPFHLGYAIVPRTLEGQLACELCLDQSTAVAQRAAAYFCDDCPMNLLCYDCKQLHDKLCGNNHRIKPFEENDEQRLADHPWARMPAVLCQLHKSTCDCWCRKCDTAKCQECALQCAKGLHSICSSGEVDMNSWVGRLKSSTLEIEKACAQFTHVESALELEHRADMLELKERKLRILNVLDSAFSAAREALESSFRETRQQIANFRYYIDSAVHCSRLLTRKPLPSHGILIQRAQRAVDCHKYTAQRLLAREEAILARLGSTTLADDLADVMKSWIGLPAVQPVPETNKIAQSTTCADNMLRNKPQMPSYDIAATLCGHVLVANGKSGLQELDSRGFLLDTWLPTSASVSTGRYSNLAANAGRDLEVVLSVDCLEDERAVVGLQNACAVILLQRESNGGSLEWREQKRFDLEQEAPFAVATRHNLLLVALGSVNKDSQILLPGKHLAAFDVKTGTRRAYTELDFEVGCVAVAGRNVVIVASHYRVNINPTSKWQFAIESRSTDLLSCLWRVTRDQPILGLAASASGTIVYASVARERGRRVIALDADTGLIAKVAVANRCNDVPNETIGVRSLEVKNCSEIRHSLDAETCDSATKIPGVVGRTCLSTDDGRQREHWLTSNIVFGKLSCSKSQTSQLVALGFDSTIVYHLSVDVEEPSLKDSLRRVMHFIREVFTIVDFLAEALIRPLVVVSLMLLLSLRLLNELQGISFDSNGLMGCFLSVCAVLSSTAFKKFLCSRSLTSKLLTLGFDSRPLFNLSADFELTLRDYLRRAQYLPKKLSALVEFLSHVLGFIFAFGVIFLFFCSVSFNEQHAICIACNRLWGYFDCFLGQDFLRVIETHLKKVVKSCAQCYVTNLKSL